MVQWSRRRRAVNGGTSAQLDCAETRTTTPQEAADGDLNDTTLIERHGQLDESISRCIGRVVRVV